jgi:hypothetical protein
LEPNQARMKMFRRWPRIKQNSLLSFAIWISWMSTQSSRCDVKLLTFWSPVIGIASRLLIDYFRINENRYFSIVLFQKKISRAIKRDKLPFRGSIWFIFALSHDNIVVSLPAPLNCTLEMPYGGNGKRKVSFFPWS